MFNHLEKELKHMLNEKKEMPLMVRQSLDQTYDVIRKKSIKKKRTFNPQVIIAIAASACLVVGLGLSNDHVMASINKWLGFDDKGVEQAVNNGMLQEDHHSVTDQGVKIAINDHFSDENKLGLSFQLAFDHPSMLKHVENVSLDYRLKNGDGQYIEEFIPDTKPLKGKNRYTSFFDYQNPFIDEKSGMVQFNTLSDSSEGTIPKLKDAVIEIESINIFDNTGKLKKINGHWNLSLSNNKKAEEMIQYKIKNVSSAIQVLKARSTPTALNIVLSLKGIDKERDEKLPSDMVIVDEAGHEYRIKGLHSISKNNETIISANFPISSYNQHKKLELMIKGIEKIHLIKQ